MNWVQPWRWWRRRVTCRQLGHLPYLLRLYTRSKRKRKRKPMNRSTTRDYNLIEQCALLFQESYFGSDKRNKPVSKREKYCGWATGQTLRIQIAGCNKSFQSLVLVLTQLHFGQWSSLPAKFDCPVARQSFSLLATAHDSETSLQCLAKTHPSYCYYCSPMRMSLLI